jgi:hypothetical protein
MKHKIIFGLGLAFIMSCNPDKKASETANKNQILIAQNIISISQLEEPLTNSEIYVVPTSDPRKIAERINPIRKVDSTVLRKIVNMALSGKIKVYENYTDTIPLSIENIKSKFKPIHFKVFKVNEKTGQETPIELDLNPFDEYLYEIRFKEDWVFNPDNASITKQAIAYALYYEVPDDRGELKDIKSFFWVKNK